MSYNKLDNENPFEDPPQLQSPPVITPTTKNNFEGGLFSINHYRQYFDLNTLDFLQNCLNSVNPLNRITAEDLSVVGDLYGSIWITGTLIFLLFFCNSASIILGEWVDDKPTLNENYLQLLIFSINLLFGYVVLIPILLYLVLKFYFHILPETRISKLISIYGYANIWWIPLSILSIIRGVLVNHNTLNVILKWCLVGFGGLFSGLSIFIKLLPVLWTLWDPVQRKTGWILILLLVLCHGGFTVGIQVCFFGALV